MSHAVNTPVPAQPLHTIGTAAHRPDALDKVSGRELFVGDLAFPRMLHGIVVRATEPHARIIAVHTGAARRMPGVAAVLTARDIPGENCVPVVFRDQPCLAAKVVRYVGEPVALVAADTPEHARRAAAAVRIEYEPLDAVFDPLVARCHATVRIFGEDNVFKHLDVVKGDTAHAFSQCDVIVENTFHTPAQEHAYLETQGMIAVPQPGGVMQVLGSMQCPFYVREAVSAVLGIPLAAAQITQTTTGGAFGGKEDVPSLPAVQAALLAHATRRPVKVIYSRDEDIICTSKRHPAVIRSKYGAKRDGTLVAAEIEYAINGGAYATLSPIVLFRGIVHAVGPYRCPHVRVSGDAVATNTVPNGAFRGFGSPQVIFAAERQMDELARKLGISPVDLRRKNLLREGDRTATNQLLTSSVGAVETLEKALERFEATSQISNVNCQMSDDKWSVKRGTGLSTIFYGVGLGAGGQRLARAGATIDITEDGSVAFAVGTTEIGQGMKTVLSQITAESLGVPLDRVRMLPTDTTRVPDSGPTVASRATTMSGRALQNAAEVLRERLLAAAAAKLNAPPARLALRNGVVLIDGAAAGISFDELLDECREQRIPLSAAGWHHPRSLEFDWQSCQGDAYVVYAFATNIAEVEVDTRTGEVRVLRIISAHDVGKAVNPQLVEGQIEGGALQGLGYALFEEIVTGDGRIRNPQFSTYIIPTACDAPEIVPVIVEHAYPDGPFGAKGFGEQPLMGIAPAVVNAVCNALGISLFDLPATPERVWQAVQPQGVRAC